MSYAIDPSVTVAGYDAAVSLDDVDGLVLVKLETSRDDASNGVVVHAYAQWADASGAPKNDSAGAPVSTRIRHTTKPGADVKTESKQCLLAVLGEPVTKLWSDALLQQCSIRNAITAAQAGPFSVSDLL